MNHSNEPMCGDEVGKVLEQSGLFAVETGGTRVTTVVTGVREGWGGDGSLLLLGRVDRVPCSNLESV